MSAYFDKLAARALGEPTRLAPPPRLRFGEPGSSDPGATGPGEHTVVTEVGPERAPRVEPQPPVPLAAGDGLPVSRSAHAPASPITQAAPFPEAGSDPMTERTRTVEREIIVREPVAQEELRQAQPSATSAVETREPAPAAPIPILPAEDVAPVTARESDRLLGPPEPERAIATDDRGSRGEPADLPRIRPLEPRPLAPEPIAVALVATTIDADLGVSTVPPVTIAIGRIELRAAGETVGSQSPAAQRPQRPPRKPALGLDEYLAQRSRG